MLCLDPAQWVLGFLISVDILSQLSNLDTCLKNL